MRPSEIAIEEYRALRQETVSHFTSMTTLVSIALTATAAIASFAFGSKPDDGYRLEILLALPLVLSGLGLANLVHTSSVLNIGYYTKTYLWDVLRQSADNSDEATLRVLSFEDLQPDPDDLPARFWPRMWLSWLPGIIVFGAPSVAALPVNTGYAWVPLVTDAPHPVGLGWAWLVDVLHRGRH